MGLDIIELMMAVEDEFEIQLDDSFGDIRTVGDLHDAIWHQLNAPRGGKSQGACPSFPPFFATRDALLSFANVDRRSIRPLTQLADVFEMKERRARWSQIQDETRINLPSLQLTAIGGPLFHLWMLLVFAITIFACLFSPSPDLITITLLAAIFFALFSYRISRRFAIAFPHSCQTVGDIVRRASPPHYPSQASEWLKSPNGFWAKVVSIVSEQLDIPKIEITREARFIEDLKCG